MTWNPNSNRKIHTLFTGRKTNTQTLGLFIYFSTHIYSITLQSENGLSWNLEVNIGQVFQHILHTVCPRVHELEEQVKDAETRADQNLEEEIKRHRETYSKMEKERNMQIDLLSNK